MPADAPEAPPLLSAAYRSTAAVAARVRDVFIEESTVVLHNFLDKDVHAALLASLRDATWAQSGPAHRRHHDVLAKGAQRPIHSLWLMCGGIYTEKEAVTSPTQSVTSQLTSYFESTSFRDLVRALTGLDGLSSHAPLSVSRFLIGHYTLVHDDDVITYPPGLDVIYFADGDGSMDDAGVAQSGGDIVYTSEEDTLLTLRPVPNSLALVMRDEGVFRFVRFRNSAGEKGSQQIMFQLQCYEDEISKE